MSNILEINHLTMKFGGLIAIDDVSFSVKKNTITSLIGPNGAGKTTVFNCITGFYKPTVGEILLNSNKKFNLERMNDFTIPQKAKVARTFQNIRLFPQMTVLENLVVAQHNKLMKASMYTLKGLINAKSFVNAENEAKELAKYWLDKINLTDRADIEAGNLPYGQQRKVEICRSMCTDPTLLCLDEPAAGLNATESLELNSLLEFIKNEHKISILLIEHDMSVVMGISDKVVVLDYGKKIAEGNPIEVKGNPEVIKAYLGEE
jgi:branched-chain amino acid transport system ATP-binding protein